MAQFGMGVWNNTLHICGGDTLTVFGDLHLFEAVVDGDGTMALSAPRRQSIFSSHSSLSNLSILNSDTVTLEGELLITSCLSVQGGIFDARNGALLLTDTILIRLSGGARLLNSKADWCAMPEGPSFPPPSSVTDFPALLAAAFPCRTQPRVIISRIFPHQMPVVCPACIFPPDPPPWRSLNFLSS